MRLIAGVKVSSAEADPTDKESPLLQPTTDRSTVSELHHVPTVTQPGVLPVASVVLLMIRKILVVGSADDQAEPAFQFVSCQPDDEPVSVAVAHRRCESGVFGHGNRTVLPQQIAGRAGVVLEARIQREQAEPRDHRRDACQGKKRARAPQNAMRRAQLGILSYLADGHPDDLTGPRYRCYAASDRFAGLSIGRYNRQP
jgi:hypothetical protein